MKITLASLVVAAALVPAAALAGSAPKAGSVHYAFAGHLLTAPSSSSLSIEVGGGTRLALKKMLGHEVNQTFSYDSSTEFLRWEKGVPTVVSASDLASGDWVRINVRAPRGASLAELEAKAPGIVGDHGAEPSRPDRPLYLFRGTLAAAGSGSVTVDVRGGDRRALRLLIGQPARQSFAYDGDTLVLRWQGKVPTVVSASDLKPGDRIVVRVRAPKGSTLAQVEATAATKLAEHEPASKS